MTRAKTVVSGGVIVYLNGQIFGRVKSFQFQSSTPISEKYGLDSTEPFELMPTVTRVSGKLGLVRTVGDGGIEGVNMAAPYPDIPRQKYFKLQLVERVSDTILFEANMCSVESQSWSASERGVVTGEIDFKGIDWSNELKSRT